jgi:hypothetical protein
VILPAGEFYSLKPLVKCHFRYYPLVRVMGRRTKALPFPFFRKRVRRKKDLRGLSELCKEVTELSSSTQS